LDINIFRPKTAATDLVEFVALPDKMGKSASAWLSPNDAESCAEIVVMMQPWLAMIPIEVLPPEPAYDEGMIFT